METTAAVIDALERAPAIVVPLVREVRPEVLKRRPAPGRWSAHEHACHLAHVHALFFERLELMLRMRDGVPLDALDGDQLQGLVERRSDRWVLTRHGRLMANAVSLHLK